MKNFAIMVFVFLLSLSIAFASYDDAGSTYYSKFKGKKYESVMPISILEQSPDFDLSKSELPVPLSKIIGVAYSQLIKVTGTKEGWEVMSITMNNWRANKKKWYYAVGFDQIDIMSLAHLTVMVTVNGQLGIIKEINEKIIN